MVTKVRTIPAASGRAMPSARLMAGQASSASGSRTIFCQASIRARLSAIRVKAEPLIASSSPFTRSIR